MTVRKGLGQANILRTNNNTSTGYGIVYADEVSGHRTVANLTALYVLNDWQLSASGDNTNNDAIGQLWYVVDADGNGNGCYYQLKDWNKRKEAAGWSEFKGTGASTAVAVTFDNTASGMTAVNAQGAIEELNVKKLAKADIVQELGNSEELVMSQKAVSDKIKELSTEQEIIYDVSARNDGAVFESLQALLSSPNLGTLIPTSVRHGGMTIRFIQGSEQSSDNKYVQYRLIADEWSTNTEDWSFCGNDFYVDNPEFIRVVLDSAGHILWAIKTDGSIYYGAGIPPQIIDYINEKIEELSLDEYKDIVAFLNNLEEGDKTLQTLLNEKVDKEEGKSLIDNEYASTKSTIDNPEFLEVVTDTEGKVLAGRTPEGAAFENVGLSTPKVYIDGSSLENAEDPEGRSEITTDSKGKIISYRDINGVMHEEVGITTKSVAVEHLNISEHGMTEFQQALIESGFNPKSVIDWSDTLSLKLPSPKCAKVNFIIRHNYSKEQIQQFKDEGKWPNILLPTTKTTNLECTSEYWDMLGNYYKKPAVLNAQGNSSMKLKIKNLTYDLNDGSEISFGGWVMQDSFHMKFYYQDFFKVYCIAAYRIGEELIKYKNCRSNRNKVGRNDSHWNFGATTDILENNAVSGALCHPDGFGVEVYINGEYQGLYMMQLKKHRKNYDMDKKNYEEVLIDNVRFSTQSVWTTFEIKNPKTLICMDGTKYDDDAPKELIDTTSEFYDSTNKDHKNTVKTKNEILRFCNAMNSIINSDNPKEKFLEFFDKDMLEVYFILYELLYGYDNAGGNWVWSCFNKIWAPNFYDLDTTCGKTASGTIIQTDSTKIFLENIETSPLGFVWANYKSEIVALWNELRNKKIIDVDNLILFYERIMRDIGISAYERQYEKYPTLPSYRNNTFDDEVVLSDNTKVKRSDYWEVTREVQDWNNDPTNFNDTKMYVIGNTCKVYVGLYNHIFFRCKQNIPEAGLAPMTFDTYVDMTNGEPVSGGFYDSLDRIKKWFNERISFLDTIFVD